MEVLIYLLPLAVLLGLAGLIAFFWSVKSGQFDDMEGPAWRILADDDETAPPKNASQDQASPDPFTPSVPPDKENPS